MVKNPTTFHLYPLYLRQFSFLVWGCMQWALDLTHRTIEWVPLTYQEGLEFLPWQFAFISHSLIVLPMKQLLFLICFLAFHSGTAFSQPCNEPPAAEDCNSAPLICNPEVLNGYCTSLTNNQTGNGPTPMCNMGNGGVPNNPIWVAFHAGCPTLHFTITPSNCTPQGGSDGIQVAIYGYDDPEGCSNSFANPDEYIACSGNCPMNAPILLTANNLQVGRIYYLAMDGCAGSFATFPFLWPSPAINPISKIGYWSPYLVRRQPALVPLQSILSNHPSEASAFIGL